MNTMTLTTIAVIKQSHENGFYPRVEITALFNGLRNPIELVCYRMKLKLAGKQLYSSETNFFEIHPAPRHANKFRVFNYRHTKAYPGQ